MVVVNRKEKDYKRLQRLVEKLQNKQAELLREKIRIEEELEHIAHNTTTILRLFAVGSCSYCN